ncbi:hypothetical protein, partial [Streptomyces sp. NPDC005969]|uniref:hypothetical protein n=1 Tax=Streptomyces sp. NPDC005969 TaxID=3156722 RepID=UPI0033CB80FB
MKLNNGAVEIDAVYLYADLTDFHRPVPGFHEHHGDEGDPRMPRRHVPSHPGLWPARSAASTVTESWRSSWVAVGPRAGLLPARARRRFHEIRSPEVRRGLADPLGQCDLHGQGRP